MTIDLKHLTEFLVRAKKATYAGDGKEVTPERPGFKELEYKEGIWSYRDSYAGFYSAPGQEVVRLEGKPVWAMAYCGGMIPQAEGDLDFARGTFDFLKKALSFPDKNLPARGPKYMKSGYWKYVNSVSGDIKDFWGEEEIKMDGQRVFSQRYMGGLIIGK